MKPVRIGILGAANIARAFVEGVAPSEKVHVSAVASRDVAKAEAFARACGAPRALGSYEALIADPEIDAIYNPLPNSLHAPWSIRAMEAGKHVLCEKPLAVSAAEAAAMFDAARANGVHLAEAYPYLSQPQTLALRALIAEGAIGRLKQIRASFGFNLTRPGDIRWDPALGGGALMDAGVYPLSLVRALAGEKPVRVQASAQWTERGVDRALAAILEFAGGLVAQISCGMDVADHRHALIVGDSGVIETHYWNHTLPHRPAELRIKRGLGPDPVFETLTQAGANGFLAEAESFADLIAGGAWNGASEAESRDIASMLDAILASARKRAWIEL